MQLALNWKIDLLSAAELYIEFCEVAAENKWNKELRHWMEPKLSEELKIPGTSKTGVEDGSLLIHFEARAHNSKFLVPRNYYNYFSQT